MKRHYLPLRRSLLICKANKYLKKTSMNRNLKFDKHLVLTYQQNLRFNSNTYTDYCKPEKLATFCSSVVIRLFKIINFINYYMSDTKRTVIGWFSGLQSKVPNAWLCCTLSSSIQFPRDTINILLASFSRLVIKGTVTEYGPWTWLVLKRCSIYSTRVSQLQWYYCYKRWQQVQKLEK